MQPKTPKQAFDFFPGIWKIDRRVTGKIPVQNAIANGYGLFIASTMDPNLMVYSEKVAIHHCNTTHIGRQQYQYRYDTTESSLSKHFHDGKLFYRLHLVDGQMNGRHLCIRDRYVSNYIFEADKLHITYKVDGPLKSYEITSVYTRISYKGICSG